MSVDLKLKRLMPEEIAAGAGGKLCRVGSDESEREPVVRVVTDSREARRGDLFVAIPGERFDGHDYIAAAVSAGCRVVLCQRIPEDCRALSFDAVVVEDSVAGLGRLAGYYRGFYRVPVVAVTGSVGKTSTKEMISAVLSAKYRTYKTKGNLNNIIGLPLTVLGIDPLDEAAVFEMGMNHFGEIAAMTRAARPDVGVITNVGTAHLEFLGSRDGICRAKMEITEGMTPSASLLLLNGDEPLLTAQADHPLSPVYFGEENGAYRLTAVRDTDGGLSFDVVTPRGGMSDLFVPAHGRHQAKNALAAIAVAEKLGLTEGEIREGLTRYAPVGLREQIREIRGIKVIVDCYNANPESMRAGIDLLLSMSRDPGARAAALLGDMLELGPAGAALHRAVGEYAAGRGVSPLFLFGRESRHMATAAETAGVQAFYEPDTDRPEALAETIARELRPGDVLLVKASRGIAAERVVEALEKAGKQAE